MSPHFFQPKIILFFQPQINVFQAQAILLVALLALRVSAGQAAQKQVIIVFINVTSFSVFHTEATVTIGL